MRNVPDADEILRRAQPLLDFEARETQPFGQLACSPIALDEHLRQQSVANLNQLIVDSISLRDLYNKHHWQVEVPTFYALHLLFDRHRQEQNALVNNIAERIHLLGGVSITMAHDVAERSNLPRVPRGREPVEVQISRLLRAHEIVLREARAMARLAADRGDDGTYDVLASEVIRTNELQVWFVAQHLVDKPIAATDAARDR